MTTKVAALRIAHTAKSSHFRFQIILMIESGVVDNSFCRRSEGPESFMEYPAGLRMHALDQSVSRLFWRATVPDSCRFEERCGGRWAHCPQKQSFLELSGATSCFGVLIACREVLTNRLRRSNERCDYVY